MKASINGHLKIVELLLRFGANPRVENARNETALTLAVIQENLDICERLIISKAEVNKKDPQGRTPLLKAARYNSKFAILELLLKYGANKDIKNNRDQTAFQIAQIKKNNDIILI